MRKLFGSSVLFALMTLSLSASAGAFKDFCGRIFMGKTPKLEAESDLSQRRSIGLLAEAKHEYNHYLRFYRKRGQRPEVRNIQRNTSMDEIFFGFHYWWVPGNVWHNLLVQENSSLAETTQINQTHAIPDSFYKPENSELVTIPTELPPLRDTQYPVDAPSGVNIPENTARTVEEPTPVVPPPVAAPVENTTPVNPEPVSTPVETPSYTPSAPSSDYCSTSSSSSSFDSGSFN